MTKINYFVIPKHVAKALVHHLEAVVDYQEEHLKMFNEDIDAKSECIDNLEACKRIINLITSDIESGLFPEN